MSDRWQHRRVQSQPWSLPVYDTNACTYVSTVTLWESGLCGRFTPCNQSSLGYIQHTHEHRHVVEYYLSTNKVLCGFTSSIHILYVPPRNETATYTASIFGCKERRGGGQVYLVACPVYHSSRNARHVILSHSSHMVTQGERPVDYNIRRYIIPRAVDSCWNEDSSPPYTYLMCQQTCIMYINTALKWHCTTAQKPCIPRAQLYKHAACTSHCYVHMHAAYIHMKSTSTSLLQRHKVPALLPYRSVDQGSHAVDTDVNITLYYFHFWLSSVFFWLAVQANVWWENIRIKNVRSSLRAPRK